MKIPKQGGVSGKWVKASEVKSGAKCKLVSEAKYVPSQFENKDGSPKEQLVAKIRFQEGGEPMNVSINRASANALIDAFTDDSVKWQGQLLTALTEKVVVAGKRVTALYLVPEGYAMGEDDNGYVVIAKEGDEESLPEVPVEEGGIKPEDIPF